KNRSPRRCDPTSANRVGVLTNCQSTGSTISPWKENGVPLVLTRRKEAVMTLFIPTFKHGKKNEVRVILKAGGPVEIMVGAVLDNSDRLGSIDYGKDQFDRP